MSKPATINLGRNESIVGIVPEYASGPGWSNAVVWVTVLDWQTNKARRECIQPDERTPAMHALFATGAAMHAALLSAVPTKKEKTP